MRLGRDDSEMGGRDVANGIIVVSRVDAGGELQGELSEDMRRGPAVICLGLVLKTREMSFESTSR